MIVTTVFRPRPRRTQRWYVVMFGLAAAFPLEAQVVDQGTLNVFRSQQFIARESFTLSNRGNRLVLQTESFYPPRRTRVTLTATVEFGADSLVDQARQCSSSGQACTTPDVRAHDVVVTIDRRLTIRSRSIPGESLREYPAPTRPLIVDDSSFALLAVPPGTGSGPVQLLRPKSDAQDEAMMTNLGFQETTVGNVTRNLLLLQIVAPGSTIRIWYDERGRLMKVEDQSRALVAERQSI